MPARLHAHFAAAPSRIFFLREDGEYVVGRDDECAVILEDPQVSRRHARIHHEKHERDGEAPGWWVEDLGSKNGLTVDGRSLLPGQRMPLQERSWLGFGDLMVRFEELGEEARQAAVEGDLRRWQTSLQMQSKLDAAEGVEALLRRTLRSMLDLSTAERGMIFLVDPQQPERLEVAAAVEAEGPDGGTAAGGLDPTALTASGGAVRRALAEGRPITLADARQDAELGSRPSIIGQGIRALVCLPLIVLGRTLGVVYADGRRPGFHFSELDVEILTAMASHAALALAVARVHRQVEGVHKALPRARPGDLHEEGSP